MITGVGVVKRKLTILAILAAIITVGIFVADILRPRQEPENTESAVDVQEEAHISAAKTLLPVMGVGETAAFPDAEQGAAYTSDNPGVLTVDPDTGIMTANAAGYANVEEKRADSSAKNLLRGR